MTRINLVTEIEYARDLVESKMPSFNFGVAAEVTGGMVVDILEVPLSSTNLSLSVSSIANVKRVIICDMDSSDEITIKVNGGSVAFPLGNFFKMSQALTSLSATNSSSTTNHKLLIIYLTEV